ncbi:MAG: branched-subunit amino acid transport protein [Paracoccaceae bacterium]
MKLDLLTLVLIVGAFTWAFRFLPIQFGFGRCAENTTLNAFFIATGPSAIATLFVGSIIPLIGDNWVQNFSVFCGIVTVIGIYWWKNSTIIATIVGAAIYGFVSEMPAF